MLNVCRRFVIRAVVSGFRMAGCESLASSKDSLVVVSDVKRFTEPVLKEFLWKFYLGGCMSLVPPIWL